MMEAPPPSRTGELQVFAVLGQHCTSKQEFHSSSSPVLQPARPHNFYKLKGWMKASNTKTVCRNINQTKKEKKKKSLNPKNPIVPKPSLGTESSRFCSFQTKSAATVRMCVSSLTFCFYLYFKPHTRYTRRMLLLQSEKPK